MGDIFLKKTEEIINLGVTFLFIIGFILLIYSNAQAVTGLAVKDIEDNTNVVIVLKDESTYSDNDTIKSQQDKFVKINNLTLVSDYDNVNAIVVKADKEDIQKILNDSNVDTIGLDQEFKIVLDTSAPLINANSVWNKQTKGINLTGNGQSVCVLDTGVNYNHPDLLGRVILGPDFVNGDNDPMDDNGHGTHVAGIIISRNDVYKGIANGANVVAVKVMNSGGGGTGTNILQGIDWCINNKDNYNISAISMSISTTNLYSNYCDGAYPALTDEINQALNNNILVMSASGNDGSSTSLPLPACITNATSIGAVDDNDNVASFSDTASFLDLLAPGVSIVSTYDSGFRALSGTSMSTPHISALALLIKQYSILESVNLNAFEIENKIKSTGKDVIDSRNGLTFKRMDVYKALLSLDNFKPELNYNNPSLVYDDKPISLTASASDTFLDSVWIEIGNNTYYTNNYTFSNSNIGENISFRFGANDSAGNSITGNYTSFVIQDGSPVLNDVEKLTAKLNYIYNYNVIATDPTNDSLTYYDDSSLFNISETGVISFLPAEIGNYTVNISVSDGMHLISDTFALEVLINNSKPNITSYYPLSPVLNENESLEFNITKEDKDDTSLSVYWYLNNNLVSTNDNYLFETSYSSSGTYNLTVIISDGIDSDAVEWNVLVNNVDLTPLASLIPDVSWNENTNATINMSNYFTDLDGDNLIYNASLTENITVYVNDNILILEPDKDLNGNKSIKFYAFDPALHYAESNFVTLTINNVPICGDNLTEGNEECDNIDLKGLSCLSRDYIGGTLKCDSECKYDYSLCTITVSSGSSSGSSGGGGTPLQQETKQEAKVVEKTETVAQPLKVGTESNITTEKVEEQTIKPKTSLIKSVFVKIWGFFKLIFYKIF